MRTKNCSSYDEWIGYWIDNINTIHTKNYFFMGNNPIRRSGQKMWPGDSESLFSNCTCTAVWITRVVFPSASDQSPLVCVTYRGATAINLEHSISKTCSLEWTRILRRPVLMVLQNLQMYRCIISKIALTYKNYCMHHSLCLVTISIGHTDLYIWSS